MPIDVPPFNDFIIVVDTREQDPYKFKGYLTVRDNLKAGDYSIQGFEEEISIERKSITDFVSSITHDRDRFKKSLNRLKQYPYRFIVIDGPLDELLSPIEIKSQGGKRKKGVLTPACSQTINVHPNAIFQTIISIMLRYGVIFFFARNRGEAEMFVYSILKKFFTIKREEASQSE